ncbi:MAG: hypothetical protein HYS80_02640 [Candidatus Aenigmarchaeota archaeon]|nr:hypothetical protein [Candidatus Aenigmarchaeota archaeon]
MQFPPEAYINNYLKGGILLKKRLYTMIKDLRPYVTGPLAGLLLTSSAVAADISQVKDVADYVIRSGTQMKNYGLNSYRIECDVNKLREKYPAMRSLGNPSEIILDTYRPKQENSALAFYLGFPEKDGKSYGKLLQDGNINYVDPDFSLDGTIDVAIEETLTPTGLLINLKNLMPLGDVKSRQKMQGLFDIVRSLECTPLTTKK